MDIQALANMIAASDSATRSNYHLTLGELRDALAEAPSLFHVVFDDDTPAGGFDSYRGYYTDIAINADAAPRTVKEWRKATAKALETTFEGYKGGDYPASPEKPLWRAEYGEASELAIVGYDYSRDAFRLLTKTVS